MKLARINTALLVLIILVNAYTIGLPALPAVIFRWQNRDGQQSMRVSRTVERLAKAAGQSAVPSGNRLFIPSMALDKQIFEGSNARTLDQGIWLRHTGSTPDKGSNTVLAGHRLTYMNPQGALYHLDKVAEGDQIALWWEGKLYRYRVIEIKTVTADEVSVEAPTDTPRLTVYTCTPLWMPKERLVVIAKQEEIHDR